MKMFDAELHPVVKHVFVIFQISVEWVIIYARDSIGLIYIAFYLKNIFQLIFLILKM